MFSSSNFLLARQHINLHEKTLERRRNFEYHFLKLRESSRPRILPKVIKLSLSRTFFLRRVVSLYYPNFPSLSITPFYPSICCRNERKKASSSIRGKKSMRGLKESTNKIPSIKIKSLIYSM